MQLVVLGLFFHKCCQLRRHGDSREQMGLVSLVNVIIFVAIFRLTDMFFCYLFTKE